MDLGSKPQACRVMAFCYTSATAMQPHRYTGRPRRPEVCRCAHSVSRCGERFVGGGTPDWRAHGLADHHLACNQESWIIGPKSLAL